MNQESARINATSEQLTHLSALVNQHPDLVSGKFSNVFTKKHAEKLWQQIAVELNQMQGATKDWKRWRKVSKNEFVDPVVS